MHPSDKILARRYAKAYMTALDGKTGSEASARKRLEILENCGKEILEIRHVLAHPFVPRGEKVKITRQALEGKADNPALNFMEALIKAQRIYLLDAVVQESRAIVENNFGYIRAEVFSAVSLGEKDLQRIISAIERRTGKKVIADVKISAGLLGGVLVKIGDLVIDSSIKGRLEGLKKTLQSN